MNHHCAECGNPIADGYGYQAYIYLEDIQKRREGKGSRQNTLAGHRLDIYYCGLCARLVDAKVHGKASSGPELAMPESLFPEAS